MSDDFPNSGSADDADERSERHMADSARQHVGAAGFAQRDVLEEIITAGREQIVYTRALRNVVVSTLQQLEAAQENSMGLEQFGSLQRIVSSGQRQIETAKKLKDAIQHALSNVLGTPLELVSAQLLTVLSESVQRQAHHLELLIQAALHEATSEEQVQHLKQTRTDVAASVLQLEHDQEEQALVRLNQLARQALEQIRNLEAEGQDHADQRTVLEDAAVVSQQRITQLKVETELNRTELERLEQQQDADGRQISQLTDYRDDLLAKLNEVRNSKQN